MATLQALYDEVDAHADTIKRLVGQDDGYQVSVTILYKLNSAGAGSLRRWIMVKDRGLAGEKAYWDGGKPTYLTAADAFPGDLQTQLTAYQAAHPEFEKYEIVNIFPSDKYAIVKAYIYAAPTSSIKNYIFWKSGATWYVRELV